MRRSIGIVIAVLGAAEAFAADTIPVSGTVLSRFVGGRTVLIDTPLGTQIPITYRPDGTLSGRAGSLSFYLGSESDTGRWWIKGDKVCQKWKRWFDGDTSCLRIQHQGRRLFWQSDDGKTGTGTLTGPSPDELLAQAQPKRSTVGAARPTAVASATAATFVAATVPVPRLVNGPLLVREGRMVRDLVSLAIARTVVAMESLPESSRTLSRLAEQDAWCRSTMPAGNGTASANPEAVQDGLATWFSLGGVATRAATDIRGPDNGGMRFGCLPAEPALVTVARIVTTGN